MYLDDQHNISRFVKPKSQIVDSDGNVIGLLPQAFEMRPEDSCKLSVNWVEYFQSDHADNIAKSVQAFRKSFKGKVQGSVFAVANVGCLKGICSDLGHDKVQVDHNGKEDAPNPAHARIIRLPENDAKVMHKLAVEVFTKFVLNGDIP